MSLRVSSIERRDDIQVTDDNKCMVRVACQIASQAMVRGCPCVGDRLQSCLLLPMLGPGQLELALGSLHQ